MAGEARVFVGVTSAVEHRDGEGVLICAFASSGHGGWLASLYERWRVRWCYGHRRDACPAHVRDGSRRDWLFALTHPF